MRKRFILTLGMLLSTYLPATAQTLSTQLGFTQERPAPMILLAAAPTQWLPASFLPVRPLAERPARLTALLAAAYNRDSNPERLSSVEVVKTPFVRQVRATVVQLCGARLELGGFISTNRMENVLLGFSASGGLAGFGVSGQGHPGATVPHGNRSYGISLTFHLGRDADVERR